MIEPPQPVIRERPDHCISRRDIDPDALKVLYRLARHNYTAYLVGGGVRDLLLGRCPKDFDVSTNAHPRQIKKLFRNCFLIGRRFRLAHIKYGPKVIETSTFRSLPDHDEDPKDPEADLFQKDDNEYGTPGEDALRRDFTINGLFYDIETFNVIDYVGGLKDLEARVVRCIGDPEIRFREDPVRMIRAVRFAGRLGFTIEPETYEAIKRHASEIEKASPPRMQEEIYRLFAFQSGEASIRLLHETGLLQYVFPELAAHLDDHDGEEPVLWRYLAALDAGDTIVPEPTPALIFGSLYYDYLLENLNHNGHMPKNSDVRELLSPASNRFRIPKKLLDRLSRMFVAQNKFEAKRRRRFSKTRFVSQDTFPESLALYEIHITATDGKADVVQKWMDLYAAHLEKRENNQNSNSPDAVGENDSRTSSRRKKRHRGGRRSGRNKSKQQDNQQKPAESDGKLDAETSDPQPATTSPAPSSNSNKKSKRRRRRRKQTPASQTTADNGTSQLKSTEAEKRAAIDDGDTTRPLSPSDFYLPKENADSPRPSKADPGKTESQKLPKKARFAENESKEAKPSSPRIQKPREMEPEAPHWLDEI